LPNLSAEVDRAAAGIAVLDAHIPDRDDYRPSILRRRAGLSSVEAGADLEPEGAWCPRFERLLRHDKPRRVL
jgi:hypothetical protein